MWMVSTLTHLPVDKMATSSQVTFQNAFSVIKRFVFRVKFHRHFGPKGPIDIKSALVQVMAWRRTGDKPLSEPMLTHFIDTYMWQ